MRHEQAAMITHIHTYILVPAHQFLKPKFAKSSSNHGEIKLLLRALEENPEAIGTERIRGSPLMFFCRTDTGDVIE